MGFIGLMLGCWVICLGEEKIGRRISRDEDRQ